MDLTYIVDNTKKFNVRSAALIRYQDYYLLSKRIDKDYYSLVGGRINYGEDSKAAIIREIKEELDFDIAVADLKLCRIVENFYNYGEVYIHEYLFVYEINVASKYFKQGNFINRENPLMQMLWFKKREVASLNLKPKIIKKCLFSADFAHIIWRN